MWCVCWCARVRSPCVYSLGPNACVFIMHAVYVTSDLGSEWIDATCQRWCWGSSRCVQHIPRNDYGRVSTTRIFHVVVVVLVFRVNITSARLSRLRRRSSCTWLCAPRVVLARIKYTQNVIRRGRRGRRTHGDILCIDSVSRFFVWVRRVPPIHLLKRESNYAGRMSWFILCVQPA